MFSNNKVIKSSMNKYKKYSGSGGGIYYTCDSDNRDCTLELAGNNQFFYNHAAVQGGAVYWDINIPKIDFINTEFSQNTATYYGDNVASYAIKLVVITRDEYQNQV